MDKQEAKKRLAGIYDLLAPRHPEGGTIEAMIGEECFLRDELLKTLKWIRKYPDVLKSTSFTRDIDAMIAKAEIVASHPNKAEATTAETSNQTWDEAEEHLRDLEHESRVDYASWETDEEDSL